MIGSSTLWIYPSEMAIPIKAELKDLAVEKDVTIESRLPPLKYCFVEDGIIPDHDEGLGVLLLQELVEILYPEDGLKTSPDALFIQIG